MDPNNAVGCLRFVLWYVYMLMCFSTAGTFGRWASDRHAAAAQSLVAFSTHASLRYHAGGVGAFLSYESGNCAYDLGREPACFLRFLLDLPGVSQPAMHRNDLYVEIEYKWIFVLKAWWLQSVERRQVSGATSAAELYYLQHLRSGAACSCGSRCSGLSSPAGVLTLLARVWSRLRQARETLERVMVAVSTMLCNLAADLGSHLQTRCPAAVAGLRTCIWYCRFLNRRIICLRGHYGRFLNGFRALLRAVQYVFFLYMGATATTYFPWMLALISLQLMWSQVPCSDLGQLAGFGCSECPVSWWDSSDELDVVLRSSHM